MDFQKDTFDSGLFINKQLKQLLKDSRISFSENQIRAFTLDRPNEPSLDRLKKIILWISSVNVQNGDGVLLTPILTDYLSRTEQIDQLLLHLSELRGLTNKGYFDPGNLIQRDLEFHRFWYEHHHSGNEPNNRNDLYKPFTKLKTLSSPNSTTNKFILDTYQQKQAKRAAFEAACLYNFIITFIKNTSKPVVVVGNDRYGRQWVVEPMQELLEHLDLEIRYDRVQSHKSYRLSVPHSIERNIREGFPLSFVKKLDSQAPHVIIVDACSPDRDAGMMRFSRASRDYVNWFMVFNDLKAGGEVSQYQNFSSLPDHINELRKWHRFQIVRKQIEPIVNIGPVYKIRHWAPVLRPKGILGDFSIFTEHPFPDMDDPKVILANPCIYNDESTTLERYLRGTESYFFSDPERHVRNKVIYGFGPYGLESRLIGPTTDMFIAAVQGAISDEVAYLLDRNLVPDDGILATLY